MMQENMPGTCPTCGGGSCKCGHHKIVPLSIIAIGIIALAGGLGYLTAMQVSIWWPIFLIIIGVMKLCGHSCKCCGPKKM